MDPDGVASDALKGLLQIRFQPRAAGEHDVGIVDGGRVRRRGHVAVGIDADAHQRGQFDLVAAHLANHVPHDIGCGDDAQFLSRVE